MNTEHEIKVIKTELRLIRYILAILLVLSGLCLSYAGHSLVIFSRAMCGTTTGNFQKTVMTTKEYFAGLTICRITGNENYKK